MSISVITCTIVIVSLSPPPLGLSSALCGTASTSLCCTTTYALSAPHRIDANDTGLRLSHISPPPSRNRMIEIVLYGLCCRTQCSMSRLSGAR
ncbi:hypothetical protein JB92DRAFT_430982 [Gautieria morchelliformis]|nr:hypothetical protein JB92DRAFT_430982 [Gautieria morchelliformis]